MRLYNINANLIRTIECLYDKVTSTVYYDNIGEWFRTTTGVRQGCLLSPTVFNIFWLMHFKTMRGQSASEAQQLHI